MINPPTRPYLPEEIARINLSEIVETKKLADITLENQASLIIATANAEPAVKKTLIDKKVLLFGGFLLVAGVVTYIFILKNAEKKSIKSANPENAKK